MDKEFINKSIVNLSSPVAVATSQYLLLLLAILKPPGRLKFPEE